MCGEFAGDKKATKLLLGMGLDSFSMSASSGLQVKKIIRSSSYADAQKYRDLVLKQNTPEEEPEEEEEFLIKIGVLTAVSKFPASSINFTST